ncbi:NAD(P)/FAD-dependent oxidoreductase [Falsihalocynthiibacter sp. SS001]|uniref:NAD(P)/FAD-dependent oxidoreductase n=1 Tax=Falsihalocynthiibacter sp. SS001 TaxID=3349698 RepID=UPI0036D3AC76
MAKVYVIGAGIIGVSSAITLQQRGHNVVLLEREAVGAGASSGNAGAFAFSDIMPLASPGILRKAPKWLFDPLGPLSIPPSYALQIAPWMIRFWRASWRDQYAQSATAQTALMEYSQSSLSKLMESTNTTHMLRPEGQLQLYDTEASFKASMAGWDFREAHGIPFRHLSSADEIAEIQPRISPSFRYATFTPEWQNITEPKQYLDHLAQYFRDNGGTIETGTVAKIQPSENGARISLEGGATVDADKVVIAAGAWARKLAASVGDKIPLETERGYNTTMPANGFDLRTHLTFGDHAFVVTKIGDRIRVGGAVELGGLVRPPDYRRSKALLAKAKQFLPDLRDDGGVEWMGFRPSLPDSLPVIGASPKNPNVIYAFGHGHLGLTQSAGTAHLVADLVSGQHPDIEISAFRPERF